MECKSLWQPRRCAWLRIYPHQFREYEITSKGVVIMGDRLTDYQGLITGIPEHLNRSGNRGERSPKSKGKSKS